MSSTASNYNMSKLIGGQIFAIIASVLAFASAWPTISNAWLSACPILAVSLVYGIMMFASSYVEEEQNFWFWTASGWLAFLALKR
jgi:ethanolaminephosphotransferase